MKGTKGGSNSRIMESKAENIHLDIFLWTQVIFFKLGIDQHGLYLVTSKWALPEIKDVNRKFW